MNKRVMAALCTIDDNSKSWFKDTPILPEREWRASRSQQSFTITIPTWEVLTRWVVSYILWISHF